MPRWISTQAVRHPDQLLWCHLLLMFAVVGMLPTNLVVSVRLGVSAPTASMLLLNRISTVSRS
jgi:hypothetical protein